MRLFKKKLWGNFAEICDDLGRAFRFRVRFGVLMRLAVGNRVAGNAIAGEINMLGEELTLESKGA